MKKYHILLVLALTLLASMSLIQAQETVEEETPARVTITTVPSGAIITVDGEDAGFSPIEIMLPPGIHTIKIAKEGYQTKKLEIKILEGERDIPLNYILVPLPREESSDMALVSAGYFTMGRDRVSRREGPSRKIYLNDFLIDRYEVTNEQYKRFVEATDRDAPPFWSKPAYKYHKLPVVGVRWKDADAYCRWSNKRLPTEAEWEKAARGAEGFLYPWGKNFDSKRANLEGAADGYVGLAPVDAFPEGKSPYGVFNMIGNAAEWTADYFSPNFYKNISLKNPTGPSKGDLRTVRGWSFRTPAKIRPTVTHRGAFPPDTADDYMGFRCARDY